MAFNFSPKIITDDLVLYLDAANTKSYPGADLGTNWIDLSKNQNDSTINNGYSFNLNNGGSIKFNGVNTYIQTNTIDLSNTNNISIDFWCKFDSYPEVSGSSKILMEFSTNFNNVTTGFAISYADNSNVSFIDYPITVAINGDVGLNISYWPKTLVNDLKWHHWSVVLDKSKSGAETLLYIDGVLQSGTFTNFNSNNTNNFGNLPLYIGGRIPNTDANLQLSNVRIYNRALTSIEVLQNYNTLRSRFLTDTVIIGGIDETFARGWSLRKLRPAYSGFCIEVRRSSDNTTSNIGFDANGNLDTSALLTFAGAGNAFVRTWYNQSTGGGLNFAQTTNANQPQIVSSGALVTNGGKVAIRITTTTFMSIASSTSSFNFIHNGGLFTIQSVFQVDALGAAQRLIANTTATNQAGFILFHGDTNSGLAIFRGVTGVQGAITDVTGLPSNYRVLHTIYGDANDAVVANRAYSYIDGGARTADNTRDFSVSTANAGTNLFLGRQSNGTFPMQGHVQEILIYNSHPQLSNRNNILNYWNV